MSCKTWIHAASHGFVTTSPSHFFHRSLEVQMNLLQVWRGSRFFSRGWWLMKLDVPWTILLLVLPTLLLKLLAAHLQMPLAFVEVFIEAGLGWFDLNMILISFSFSGRFQAAFICSASHDCEYLAPCSAGHFELSSVGDLGPQALSEWHPLLAKIQISKSYPKQRFSKFNILPIYRIYTDFDVNPLTLGPFKKKSNLSAIQKLRTWPGAQMLLVEGLLGLAALVLSFPEAVGDLSLLTNVRAFYEQDYLCESVSCILMLSEQVMILKIRFKIATFQIKIPPKWINQWLSIYQDFSRIPQNWNP